MRRLRAIAAGLFAALVAFAPGHATAGSRIKDIASLQAARDNQLIGYGLVVGLQGTGDSLRNSPFTGQSLQAMLENLGVATRAQAVRSKNIAAVMVTATLPPFASGGSRIDVEVASLGDATSLRGGQLVMTSLSAADGEIYAVAQGSLVVSGFNAQGQGATLNQGTTTAGRVPEGAIVERELPKDLESDGQLVLQLHNPDFTTAVRVADRINAFARQRYGTPLARAKNSTVVTVRPPHGSHLTRLMANIEDLTVDTETPAKVVVNERTGTIVIGANVQISKVAVSYGTLTVQVQENPQVSQPAPFSDGATVVTPQTDIAAQTEGGRVAIMQGPDLRTLVAGLNRIGVKPDGIIAILQAIKSAGALHAKLVVQ
ncbi:flagellar basal body P-ring protein FlgI [Pararhizobium mangrovi]|uniref:Flagellar P-ring protein n=1 Tax=Pararhizobium mangrovi TaxID=2590452 RepID=A0A506U0Z9_9HYPH|nr:flagellar basal body P-ring protein FlgI [Pararhizobium mangrovi]TPW26891.1 flagellar basal body P-ring protein FlgI [Pararhizobium mangrovi]